LPPILALGRQWINLFQGFDLSLVVFFLTRKDVFGFLHLESISMNWVFVHLGGLFCDFLRFSDLSLYPLMLPGDLPFIYLPIFKGPQSFACPTSVHFRSGYARSPCTTFASVGLPRAR
jgi:hypothetical protein